MYDVTTTKKIVNNLGMLVISKETVEWVIKI